MLMLDVRFLYFGILISIEFFFGFGFSIVDVVGLGAVFDFGIFVCGCCMLDLGFWISDVWIFDLVVAILISGFVIYDL